MFIYFQSSLEKLKITDQMKNHTQFQTTMAKTMNHSFQTKTAEKKIFRKQDSYVDIDTLLNELKQI